MLKAFLSVYIATSLVNFHIKEMGFENGRSDYSFRRTGKIDFAESSGMESEDKTKFWTHNDSGGDTALRLFSLTGKLLETSTYQGISNIDWEDITRDDSGNFYIGEFGNNGNRRRDLKIYKINDQRIETIHFTWEDQKDFPPKADEMNFDCEAFYWQGGQLYLFSKNRGTGATKAYVLNDSSGTQVARHIDSFNFPGMITSADINDSETEIVLLSYGIYYTFTLKNPEKPFEYPFRARKIRRGAQSEGITYIGDDVLLISNEQGRIFRLKQKRTSPDQ